MTQVAVFFCSWTLYIRSTVHMHGYLQSWCCHHGSSDVNIGRGLNFTSNARDLLLAADFWITSESLYHSFINSSCVFWTSSFLKLLAKYYSFIVLPYSNSLIMSYHFKSPMVPTQAFIGFDFFPLLCERAVLSVLLTNCMHLELYKSMLILCHMFKKTLLLQIQAVPKLQVELCQQIFCILVFGTL